MKHPDDIRELLSKRFRNQRGNWLRGQGQWPLTVSLGCPTEAHAEQSHAATRAWLAAWEQCRYPGELIRCERRWRGIGTQLLPERLVLASAAEVADWVDESTRWTRARSRYERFCDRWPMLALKLARYFDVLADLHDTEMERLYAVLCWLESNPRSNLYPRQLPIGGLDSKWLESRKTIVSDLFAEIAGASGCDERANASADDAIAQGDFYATCGLRPLPMAVRMLILDAGLRRRVGGFRDVTVRAGELANATWSTRRCYIVENVQTALAFGDLPGSIVIMGLGYGVDVLSRIPALEHCECIYWGDIDSHGLAILNRARVHLPQIESVLMDETTLLRHRVLWSTESDQVTLDTLPNLNAVELGLFQALKQQRWGRNVRLEQERIGWAEAWEVLRR